jgi:hypothetical protein
MTVRTNPGFDGNEGRLDAEGNESLRIHHYSIRGDFNRLSLVFLEPILLKTGWRINMAKVGGSERLYESVVPANPNLY